MEISGSHDDNYEMVVFWDVAPRSREWLTLRPDDGGSNQSRDEG
jgi:hypothetical protein